MIQWLVILCLLMTPWPALGNSGTWPSPGTKAWSSGGGGSADQAYDAQVRFGTNHTSGTVFKVVLLSTTGTVLAVSNPGSLPAGGIVTVTFPSPYTLSASTAYRCGIIGDGYSDVGLADAGSWEGKRNTGNSYTTPVNVTPSTDDDLSYAMLAISIRNSSGTVLLGSTAGSAHQDGVNLNNIMIYWASEETY